MQYLESIWSEITVLTSTIINDPSAILIASGIVAVLVLIAVWMFLRFNCRKKCSDLQEEANIRYSRLQYLMKNNAEKLVIVEQKHQQQSKLLNNVQEENTKLQDQVKDTPKLEQQVVRQLRKIAALTETIESEFQYNESNEVEDFVNDDPISKHETVVNHLTSNLQKELTSLHDHIAVQSDLITNLQDQLAHEKESLAEQIVIKGQQLPKLAKQRFDEQVVEPIYNQIDGIKNIVQSIPVLTKDQLDQHLLIPLNKQFNGIKTNLTNIPTNASNQIQKSVLNPINNFTADLNQKVSSVPGLTEAKINQLILSPLSRLIEEIKTRTSKMPGNLADTVMRTVVAPLEQTLSKLLQMMKDSQENTLIRLKHQVVKPITEKFANFTSTGTSASIDAIKQIGRKILQSIRKEPVANTAAPSN